MIRDGAEILIIPAATIDYVRGQDDYVEVFYDSRSALTQQTLQHLEGNLDPSQFVHVHRSYLLNVSRVARSEPWGQRSKMAVLKWPNRSREPLGRSAPAHKATKPSHYVGAWVSVVRFEASRLLEGATRWKTWNIAEILRESAALRCSCSAAKAAFWETVPAEQGLAESPARGAPAGPVVRTSSAATAP